MTDSALHPVITTLVFDFGGVVQELMDEAIIQTLATTLGVPLAQFVPHYDKALPEVQTGRLSEDKFLADLNQLSGNAAHTLSRDLLVGPFVDGSHLYPEMTALLDELKEKDVEIVVLSNTIPSHAQLNRQRDNYRWFGHNVFLSCEIGLLKPKSESFLYVAKHLARRQEQLVLIDDQDKNISGARSVNMTAVKHDSKTMPIGDLRAALRSLGIPT